MKKFVILLAVLIIGGIYLPVKMENDHKKRFHEFMKTYAVDYTDSGCEFGWEMTRRPYTANYTLEKAMQLVDSIPQDMYNKYFSTNNE